MSRHSPGDDRPLRVALLSYRGDPYCGGQGVYVRHLSRELQRLGHHVEIFSGPPYPLLDDGVRLTRVPSLDLFRQPDPWRIPGLREYRDWIDLLEFAGMATAGFPEPLTFSLRMRRLLRRRRADFDVVHDNQTLGYGLLGLPAAGPPLVETIHHPVHVDRALELAATRGVRRLTLRRWYGFTRMQRRVATRLRTVIAVSHAARDDVVTHLGVPSGRITVVPNGVDPARFSPRAPGAKRPGRIVTTASADVPLKGLLPLVEAVAKLASRRAVELVVVGSPRPDGPVLRAVHRHDLGEVVRFTGRIPEQELVELLRSAEVAVVPSLYEGFSFPAVEAMACGLPVVATTAGSLPQVVGAHGRAALLVPPGDEGALAGAVDQLLDDEALRARLGAAGRARVLAHFTWHAAAVATVARYRAALTGAARC